MRIGVDAHSVSDAGTGNKSYAAGLMHALLGIDRVNEYLFYVKEDSSGSDHLPSDAQAHFKLVSNSALGRLCVSLPRASVQDSLDVLHVVYFPPVFWRGGLVVTIHDLCYGHYPSSFSRKERIVHPRWIYWGARRADAVITVSEFSKRDIVRLTNVPADKVVVIPNGIAEHFYREMDPATVAGVGRRYQLGSSYLLFVGRTDDPRKNIETLIRAYASLREANVIQHRLVVAGRKGSHTANLIELVDSLGLSSEVSFPGIIPDDDLPALMAAADAFVYPSLFEGFGLPVLEAMACGTPVITSDQSSLPEVAGDAALIVSATDVTQLADAMRKVVCDRTLHTRLSHAGRARAKLYSWSRAAKSTLSVYETVYEQSSRARGRKRN